MLFIITSIGEALFKFINIDDQFLDAAHISTLNFDKMAKNKPIKFAYEVFSIKRIFQQFKSRPPRFNENGVGKRQQ